MAPILHLLTFGSSLVSLGLLVLHRYQTQRRYWIFKLSGDPDKRFSYFLILLWENHWLGWVGGEGVKWCWLCWVSGMCWRPEVSCNDQESRGLSWYQGAQTLGSTLVSFSSHIFLLYGWAYYYWFEVQLLAEDLMVKEKLFKHFSGRIASPSGGPTRMVRWFKVLSKTEKLMRQVGFIALWLSKFLFGEFPRYGIKSAFFPLAIQIARGISYSLAPMFLGHLYS